MSDHSLAFHRDFVRLWAATALSEVGTVVTRLAVPLVAVTTLHATALQVGLLTTFQYLAFLVIGLPTGAWVDRMRRRRVMIVADLGRFVVLGTVPLSAALGTLTIWQLYAVVLVTGCLTVFFDVAYQSYLPSLVGRPRLVEGNAKLHGTQSAAEVAGPSLGGLLVQALTAPMTILLDAVSFLWSAALLTTIRHVEERPTRVGRRPLFQEVREGVELVLRHPLLRAIAACTATCNLWMAAGQSMLIVLLARGLALSAGAIGLLLSTAALGGLLGAVVARRLASRLGQGPAIWLSIAVTSPLLLVQPFLQRDWTLGAFVVSQFAFGVGTVVYNITQVSFRQTLCPDRLLGRMNATMRFVVWGSIPLGGLLGGALGSWLGVRAALLIAAIGASLAFLWVFLSPLRSTRDLAEPPVESAPR